MDNPYLEEEKARVKSFMDELRDSQRSALRPIFENFKNSQIEHYASIVECEPSVDSLLERHGDGGEFAVVMLEKGGAGLTWVPYKDNPRYVERFVKPFFVTEFLGKLEDE